MAGQTSTRAPGGQRRQGASRGASGPSSGMPQALRWYVGGLVSGVFLSFMFYLVTLPPSESARQSARAIDTASSGTTGQQPRFDFFDMLPQQRIEVEVDPGSLPVGRDQPDGSTYVLQAGSFRHAEDADRRRAELLLLGLEPKVEETKGSNGRWFRVLVGPFDSRSKMAAARSLTAQQNIDTLLLKRSAP